MKNISSSDRRTLIYKRGILDKCIWAFLGTTYMACFAILSVGCLLYEAASLSGFSGVQPPVWNTVKAGTLADKAFYLLGVLACCLMAYYSVGSLVMTIKDVFTPSRKYEGVLKTVKERSYSGIRTRYKLLALECDDTTWEISPWLRHSYLLQPGKKIRVFFSGGTKTIKTLWVLKQKNLSS